MASSTQSCEAGIPRERWPRPSRRVRKFGGHAASARFGSRVSILTRRRSRSVRVKVDSKTVWRSGGCSPKRSSRWGERVERAEVVAPPARTTCSERRGPAPAVSPTGGTATRFLFGSDPVELWVRRRGASSRRSRATGGHRRGSTCSRPSSACACARLLRSALSTLAESRDTLLMLACE